MILITGGGTGGHLSIAKSIKEELNAIGIKPIYIGSNSGQDRAWFENESGFLDKLFLDSTSVVNRGFLGRVFAILNILLNSIKLITIFKKYKIKKVFCVGGYSSASASICAILLRVDLYIHEQNAVNGRLTSLLKKFSKKFYTPFNSNYPVSLKFFELARERKSLKRVIFLGGSQGALAINNLALSVAKELNSRGIEIVHQCGSRDYKRVKYEYEKLGVEPNLFAFDKDLALWISKADFAISRSGASTLWELVANQIPSLFIPYPYAAKNHQYFNAKSLSDKKLAFLRNQDEVTDRYLLDIIDNRDELFRISSDLADVISPNGAKEITKDLI